MKNKKLLLGMSTLLAISLFATGCGKEIEVKNGSKVAVSMKGEKYTATEYYNKIKEKNISTLIELMDHNLFDKKYKEDEEEKKYIDNQISQIKSYYGSNEESYNAVIKQYFGVDSEKELKNKLSLEYKRQKAVKEHVKDNIKEKEIKDYYEENTMGQVKASHILISVNTKKDASDDEKKEAEKKAKKKAEKVIKELEKGKKFEDLAKKYSEDTATASNGGDLGYFDLNDMVSEFSNAVKELKKDEYTKEPIKTEYGYHIILKKDQKAKPKLSKVKKDIIEKLAEQKLNNDNSLYYTSLKEIREENKIKWNDSSLKKAYNDYMDDLIKTAKNNSN